MEPKKYVYRMEFSGVLTLIFITLKLIGKITWPWLWVLSPLWIPLAALFGLALVYYLFALLTSRK